MPAAGEWQSPGWDVLTAFTKNNWENLLFSGNFRKIKKEEKNRVRATELFLASCSPGSGRVKRLAESKQNSEISSEYSLRAWPRSGLLSSFYESVSKICSHS